MNCNACGGELQVDAEDEMACKSCGSVVKDETVPLDLSPYERSPLNHGVVGKNLGTDQRVVYSLLRRAGQVSGVLSRWELDGIVEDSLLRDEVMWFTNLVLKMGIGDVDVDPLARKFRNHLNNIQDEEEAEMKKRVRHRAQILHPTFEGLLRHKKMEKIAEHFLEVR